MRADSTVVTFARTLDAFAFEDAARAGGVPGRIIPLPTGIAASCGLAWLLPPGHPPGALVPLAGLRREGVYRFDGHTYVRLGA